MSKQARGKSLVVGSLLFVFGGCAQMVPNPPPPSAGHLSAQDTVQADSGIPAVVPQASYVPPRNRSPNPNATRWS